MFCFQCEQTAQGTGCTHGGVCGKDERTAVLQDLLLEYCQRIALAVEKGDYAGFSTETECGRFLLDALFTTVTNVNFDEHRVAQMIKRAIAVQRFAGNATTTVGACSKGTQKDMEEEPNRAEIDSFVQEGLKYSIADRRQKGGATVVGLQELILYGLKGSAAYAHHAGVLGVWDSDHLADYVRVLAFLAKKPTNISELLEMSMKVGQINYRAMQLLDQANTETFGKPEPTSVRITPISGKCILVSGHDLKDLHDLLEQTAGKGLNVYTHGEMLPCCAYPKMKQFPHLAGNYGGAWQNQQKEFDEFPGPILMTTNCIQRPRESYKGRIFTTGLVAFPGVGHIPALKDGTKDFSAIIESAQNMPGFAETEPEKTILIGFGADAVLAVADQVVNAVKTGKLRHLFLIGGCDGAKPGRNYYTELACSVPNDCLILTLACGKYRFNKLEFGTLEGLPRLLDMGQCNDSYSAIRVALALADVFQCGVNELPLTLVLSWYEQKAVAILLTLLSLGVKNIRLGPSLPALATPEILDVLTGPFGLKPLTTVEEDLKEMLA
ncbi:MAG: hydroxylamine reductase [Thermoguttaceae bacterium]